MQVNSETISALISLHAGESDLIELILEAQESFEKYHQAIYALEIRRDLHVRGAMDTETYREQIPHLDEIRSQRHNAVINNVRILNRLAGQDGLKPFYEGVVSEERPYRTELADAVLLYVREIIEKRVKGK